MSCLQSTVVSQVLWTSRSLPSGGSRQGRASSISSRSYISQRRFSLMAAALAVLLLVSVGIFCFPTPVRASSLPEFAADERVIVIDDVSGQVLFEQGADEKAYPASTTKLMSALVALDYVGDKLDEQATAGDELNNIPEDSTIAELSSGDSYTWKDLLYGMLLPSGTDAALTIAAEVGRIAAGDEDLAADDAVAVFVDAMNEKAADLGCDNTHFTNPHGYYDDDHYSTARDIMIIARASLANDVIREIVATATYSCTSADGVELTWYSTNWLLDKTCESITDGVLEGWGEGSVENPYYNDRCTGVKTGYMPQAGRCLVYSAADDDNSFLAVTLNAQDRPTLYTEANETIAAVLDNYDRCVFSDAEMPLAEIALENVSVLFRLNGGDASLSVSTDGEAIYSVDTTQDVETKVVMYESYLVADGIKYRLKSNIMPGTQIGELEVLVDGEIQQSWPLYADNEVVPFGLRDVLMILIGGLIVITLALGTYMIKGQKNNNNTSSGEVKNKDDNNSSS